MAHSYTCSTRWEHCAPAGALEESHEELAGARQAARLYNQAMDEVQRLRGENGVLRAHAAGELPATSDGG